MFLYKQLHFANIRDLIMYASGVEEYIYASEEHKHKLHSMYSGCGLPPIGNYVR